MEIGNLDLDIAGTLAERAICMVEVIGGLEPGDLAGALERRLGAPAGDIADAASAFVIEEHDDPKDLKKLRAKHHSVARLMAMGMSQRMVAGLTGYTEGYLSILLDTPAMTELCAIYQSQLTAGHELIAERLRTVGDAALQELEARLENKEARAKMDVHELTSILKTGMDRSGHGPQSKHHIVSEQHVFDHAELRRRDRDARAASSERILAAAPTPALPAPDAADG